VRGTTVALYDYAFYCKHMFEIDSIIMYDNNHPANDEKTIQKFKKEFNIVESYNSPLEMQNKISSIYFRCYRVKPFDPCTNCSGVWNSFIKKLKKLL
jgi:hypothetical protein